MKKSEMALFLLFAMIIVSNGTSNATSSGTDYSAILDACRFVTRILFGI